jgi:hypothetical protein
LGRRRQRRARNRSAVGGLSLVELSPLTRRAYSSPSDECAADSHRPGKRRPRGYSAARGYGRHRAVPQLIGVLPFHWARKWSWRVGVPKQSPCPMSASNRAASSLEVCWEAPSIAARAPSTDGSRSSPLAPRAGMQPPSSGPVMTAWRSSATYGKDDRGGICAHCEPMAHAGGSLASGAGEGPSYRPDAVVL